MTGRGTTAEQIDPAGSDGRLTVGTPGGLGLVVIAVVLVLAELAAGLITRAVPEPLRWYDAATELRVEQMDRSGPVDVVFAGTSMAWQGLVPDAFTAADPDGRTAFNVGLAGGIPAVTGPWLTSAVADRLDPDVIVWGLSTLDLSPAYGDAQVQAWTSSTEGRPGALGVLDRSASSVSALIAHRTQLRRPASVWGQDQAQVVTDRQDAVAITGPDGERLDFTTGRTSDLAAVQRTRLEGFTIDPVDVTAVVEAAQHLRADGVEVVLAELPVSPAFTELHPRGAADVALTRQALATLAEEIDAPFLPLIGDYDDTAFVDFTHLSAEAAARFTREVSSGLGHFVRGARTDGETIDADVQVSPEAAAALDRWVGMSVATTVLTPLRLAATDGCTGAEDTMDGARAASDAGLAQLEDPATVALLGDVLDAATELWRSCATEGRWREAATAALDAAERAARRLEVGVAAPGPRTPAGAVATFAAGATTDRLAAAVMSAYERLDWLLEGAGEPRLHRNEIWWSYGHRDLVGRLLDPLDGPARAADAGPIADLVVLGTSQARGGISADLLGDLTGTRVLNAAVDGATVDFLDIWGPFVRTRAQPDAAVLVVSGVDVLTVVGPPCPTNSRDGFRAAWDVVTTAGAGVPWLDAEGRRLAADAGDDLPLRSPMVAAAAPNPDLDHADVPEAQIAEHGRIYLRAYERFSLCEERLDAISRSIAALVAGGVEVSVVVHPVRSNLRDAAPAGALAGLDDRIEQLARDAGAVRVLRYTDALDDAAMGDVVHVTAAGAEQLTRLLAADLVQAGATGEGSS